MRNFRMEVTKSNADGAKDVTRVSEAVQMRKAQATLRARALSRQRSHYLHLFHYCCFKGSISRVLKLSR